MKTHNTSIQNDEQPLSGTPSCPSSEKLVAFAEGTLNPVAKYFLQRHLRRCSDCAVLALRLKRTVAAEKPEALPAPRPAISRSQLGSLTLAGACCGSLLTFLLLPLAPPPSSPQEEAGVVNKGFALTGAAGAIEGILHPTAKQLEEAIGELEVVIQKYPNDPLLFEALARNYEQLVRIAKTPAKKELARSRANEARNQEKRIRKR